MVIIAVSKTAVLGSSPSTFARDCAGIAQLVEQLICNHQARGSNPRAGTIIR